MPTVFFSRHPIWVPPLEEQRRIAEILDSIDETIQATERIVAKRRREFADRACSLSLLNGRLGSASPKDQTIE